MRRTFFQIYFTLTNLQPKHSDFYFPDIEILIDNTLEIFFYSKNIIYAKNLYHLFIYEILFKNLKKQSLATKFSTKKQLLNPLNNLIKKITNRNTEINILPKNKLISITEPRKTKNRTFGYLFFYSAIKAFNKSGQLKKSLQKIVTGVLESKKISNSKKIKKAKFSTLFFILLKKINPLYHNRRFNLGRKTFIIPEPLYTRKKKLFAARWLKKALKNKKEIFLRKFSIEFLNIFKGKGDTLKLKQENVNLAKKNFGNINRKFYKKKRR